VTITVISNIEKYAFRETDNFLLDTNILLSVYGPNANQERYTQAYSDALMKMRVCGCKIFIDALVLSEFINRFAHWNYDQLPPERKPEKFKYYRTSDEFKKAAQEIADDTRRIVDYTTCIDSDFGSIDIDELLNEYELGNSDFNDLVIARLCKRRGFILVTHDGDFRSCGIDLLTANYRLLR